MPGFIPPQLATLKLKAPMGDKWIHEIKFDGYRVQVHLNKGKAKIYTRNGHDWTNRFHLIAESFNIPVERAIFDGEVVVIKDGRTNFSGCTRQRPTEKHAPLRFRDAASLMASADATGRTTREKLSTPIHSSKNSRSAISKTGPIGRCTVIRPRTQESCLAQATRRYAYRKSNPTGK
jgi:ATP-dependent DNA ligase